ncbi:YwqG family protein [Priestia megaterium]|uniref:YwqG family protein n=1 Tax=Priestia megaterium TaxID=1404 RepID=UPI000BEE4330|nr:YwqG family protein [Priestia megaterium]MDW4511505.1 YwqG family protein [Priestia megaterium]PEC46550.1 hypothetical protein CON11_02885 [Priestia megaterium]
MNPLSKLELPPKLEPYRKEIEKTCKPYIHINTVMNSPKLYESKFGGNPYLPLEANHPLDSQGKPMLLMAQINFSEVPSYENMPVQGMLQFFICGANNESTGDMYGLDFDHPTVQKDFRVVFYEDVTTDEKKLTTDFTYLEDIDRDMFPIPQEVGLQFEIKIEPVSPTDYRYNDIESDLFDDEETEEIYWDELTGEYHKMGGYAFFTQSDPRDYEEALRAYDVLLLQFAMDDEADIMFGDTGVANFFIKEKDLRNRNFRDVLYNWDCC